MYASNPNYKPPRTKKACQNCGHKHDLRECPQCNYPYEEPKTKELPPCTIITCDKCGCTYKDYCPTHGEAPPSTRPQYYGGGW